MLCYLHVHKKVWKTRTDYANMMRKAEKMFPVVTLILYFGEQHWNRPHSLHDCLDIPEELKPFVSDYKVNVFEIAWLSDEQVKLFQSDFRFVADYYVQMRKNRNYVPPKEVVAHVHEVLQLMAAISRDSRFERAANEVKRGEKITMDRFLDEVENRGIQKGISIGEARAAKNYESVLAEKDAKYAALEKELARYKAMAMKQ